MKRYELLKIVKDKLAVSGVIDTSEAEFLLALTLKIKRNEVFSNKTVSKNEEKQVYKNLKRRVKGVPISIIFKSVNFYGREFYVNTNCLAPRPETEELTALVNENLTNKNAKILDLCTGSGAIAITLNLEFNFNNVMACDKSRMTLNIAKRNAKKLKSNVKFIKSNLFSKLNGQKFDFIVSNPPYISEEDYEHLDKVVRNFEPKMALVAKENGLWFYKKIIKLAPFYLNKDGKIAFEVGKNQAKLVARLLQQDYNKIEIVKDLEGVDRMVIATLGE